MIILSLIQNFLPAFDKLVSQFSCSVVSDSLWHHGLQHTRPPCPSPTPGAYSNSCPLSWWCRPIISSSVLPFSSCLQSFPASGVFSNESVLHIRWPKYWSFSFSISPSNEYSGLISLRMDKLDLPAMEPPDLTQDWGNRLLERTNKTLCTPGPRRKGQWPHKRLTQMCPWVSRSLQWRRGRQWPAAGSGALSTVVGAQDLLKEVAIRFIDSTIVWPQVKQQGGNTALPINTKDLLSMALPIRTRPRFPPQSVSPIRNLPEASYPSPSEGRQTENHNHRKITKVITWTARWNYEPCSVGPPKMDGSWWRVLTKCGPLEKGMANHFSILVLRTPWTVWKSIWKGFHLICSVFL